MNNKLDSCLVCDEMNPDYIPTTLTVYLDGHEVENFINDGVYVIGQNDFNRTDFLKCYDDFTGKVTLSDEQAHNLISVLIQLAFRKPQDNNQN